jgi:hypothetical protein
LVSRETKIIRWVDRAGRVDAPLFDLVQGARKGV